MQCSTQNLWLILWQLMNARVMSTELHKRCVDISILFYLRKMLLHFHRCAVKFTDVQLFVFRCFLCNNTCVSGENTEKHRNNYDQPTGVHIVRFALNELIWGMIMMTDFLVFLQSCRTIVSTGHLPSADIKRIHGRMNRWMILTSTKILSSSFVHLEPYAGVD